MIKIADRYLLSELRTIESLELEIKDDEIIGNVALFNKKNNENAVLLTHDYGMQLKAESFCDVIFIPDNWLSITKDELEKENESLKLQLKTFQEREPKIECNFFVKDIQIQNNAKGHLNFTLYECLSEMQISDYLADIKHHSPAISWEEPSEFEKRIQPMSGLRYYPPSQKEIEEYNKKYAGWLKHQESVLKDFSKNHNESLLILPIHIELENKGTSPAENLEISFSSKSGFFFETDDLDEYKNNILKYFWHIPEPPKGTYKSISSMYILPLGEDFNFIPPTPLNRFYPEIQHEEERDKFAFYPFFEDGRLIIQCDEMQHGKEKFVFDCYFQIEEDRLRKDTIDFSYHIYAKNISVPIDRTNTVTIDINRLPVIELLEQELAESDCI